MLSESIILHMYKVEIENRGDYRFDVRSKDYQFVVDTNGKGITPPDTLLASLGSCVGVYIRKYFESAKIAVPHFKVFVEGDLGKEAPYLFRAISVKIDMEGAPLDERRKTALLNFIKNCPIHNTLKANPAVEISI